MRDFFVDIWNSIRDLAVSAWEWLIDGAAEEFWGSRLFWACGIALAVLALVIFIICRRESARRSRLRTAAIDRLRDDSLNRAILNRTEEAPPISEPGAFLLHRRRKTRRRNFLRLAEQSELSHRELIFSTEKEITIGRLESCGVVMRDRYAANLHAVILREGRKVFIRTDQAALPVYLRHCLRIRRLEPYRAYRLRSGDTFQIGISQFEARIFNCRIPGGYI